MSSRDFMGMRSVQFTDAYTGLLECLLRQGSEEVNARTGVKIKALEGGVSFKLDISDNLLPVVGVRKLFPRSAAAETAWYLRARRDVAWIAAYAPKLWEKFSEEAGKHHLPEEEPDTPVIEAAYGYRWRRRFGRDQIGLAVDALIKNPTDRRVYVAAWDPHSDGLGAEGQKNVPCPVGFTLSIVDGALHSSYTLRSSDVFVGLPYDVMGHAMLMAVIATDLNRRANYHVGLGTIHFTLAHAHLYDRHFDMAREALRQPWVEEKPPLCFTHGVSQFDGDPADFVQWYADTSARVRWPEYTPRPEVIV